MVCRRSGIVGSAGGMPSDAGCASLSFSLCASGMCVLCVCLCVGSRTGAQLVLLCMDPGVWSVDVLALRFSNGHVWEAQPKAKLAKNAVSASGRGSRVARN